MDRWINGTKQTKKKILFILNVYISYISYKGNFCASKCTRLNCVFNTSKLTFMRCVKV